MGYSSASTDMNLKLMKMKTLLRFMNDIQCHGAIESHKKSALPECSDGITVKTDPSHLFLGKTFVDIINKTCTPDHRIYSKPLLQNKII